MTLPTSALTFEDLIIETARMVGVASYGAGGDGAVAVPTGTYDLAEVKRHVNNGIRMFLNDGPEPNGWHFLRPVGEFSIWGDIAVDADNTISLDSYDAGTNRTTLIAEEDSFYETMEGKSIVITGVGTFTIYSYTSATTIVVSGDAQAASSDTWSIASNGNYTLPASFGGQYAGAITYSSGSNQGVSIDWVPEGHIRQWRENVVDESGDPFWAAVRIMGTKFDDRRRWELMLYPSPDEVDTVEFPFHLSFDKLVNLTEHPPVPIGHDEALKAACLAVAEKDVEGVRGNNWDYYIERALPKSHQVDFRSAPKKIGYIGNPSSPNVSPIKFFRGYMYDRPTVSYDTSS